VVSFFSSHSNLWKDLEKVEKKRQGRSVYRTLSGEVIVCHPGLAREVLSRADTLIGRVPPFWRHGTGSLSEDARRSLNRWVVQRLYDQDPTQAARIAVQRVLSEDGDLHSICVRSLIDALKDPMGCGGRPELERIVRTFFDQVFLPTILGKISKRRNESLFEECSLGAGKCLINSWPELFPADLGFEAEPDFLTRIGDLYLRRTAAFVASSSIALSWALTVLFSDCPLTVSGTPPVRETDPQWVALECLRLWPPSWRLRRTVSSNQAIGPVSALAGDGLQIIVHAVQRHPDVWPEPHTFKPDRWQNTSPRELLAFGSGAGSCVGARFATEWLTSAVSALQKERLIVRQIGRHPNVTTSFSPPISHLAKI